MTYRRTVALWHDTYPHWQPGWGAQSKSLKDNGDISRNGRSQVATAVPGFVSGADETPAPREPPSAERRIRWCGGW